MWFLGLLRAGYEFYLVSGMLERLVRCLFSAGCRSLVPGLWKARGVGETHTRLAATLLELLSTTHVHVPWHDAISVSIDCSGLSSNSLSHERQVLGISHRLCAWPHIQHDDSVQYSLSHLRQKVPERLPSSFHNS